MVVPFLLDAHHHLASPLRRGLPLSGEPDEPRPAVIRIRDALHESFPFQRRDQQARGLLGDLRCECSSYLAHIGRAKWLRFRTDVQSTYLGFTYHCRSTRSRSAVFGSDCAKQFDQCEPSTANNDTRTHQNMTWSRQRQANMLRSMLREFYPAALLAFGDDLVGRDALAVLAVAPSPNHGARLTVGRVTTVLRKAGRQRNHQDAAARIVAALGTEQLTARSGVVPAYTASVTALVAVLMAVSSDRCAR